MNVIAKLLRDAREDLDLSQMDVMKKTGISNKALSRYENGATEPDIDTLAVLFGLYGLSLDSALGLRSNYVAQEQLSAEERRLVRQLRDLPHELRDMIFRETDALYSFEANKTVDT